MKLTARLAIARAHTYKLVRPLMDYHVVVVHYGLEVSWVAVVTPDKGPWIDSDCEVKGLGQCKIIKTFYTRPIEL